MLYKLGGSSFLPAMPSARVSPRASSMPLTPRPSPPYYPGRAHQASPRSQTPRTSRVRALEVEVKHLRVAAFQSHTKAKFWESAAARARADAEEAERGKQETERRSMTSVPPPPRPQAPAPPPPQTPARTPKSYDADELASEWTTACWLKSPSVLINHFLAEVLLGKDFPKGDDQLDRLRADGASDTLEATLLERFDNIREELVAYLAPLLKDLTKKKVATVGEMQDKFSQDTKGMLEYGSLNEFYGGLEGKVGSPNPKVRATMAEEHTKRGDSTRMFKPNNYDVLTCPDLEWKFTTSPDTPPEGGWPEEEKIRRAHDGAEGADMDAIRSSGAKMRKPMSPPVLEALIEKHANAPLRELGEPLLTMDEGTGLRMYTGPMCAAQRNEPVTTPSQLRHS